MNPFSLEGKTILITGASSGIGAQCAIDCSKMGAKVVLVARNEQRLSKTLSSMEGDGHLSVSIDLTNFAELKDSVKSIVGQVGPINGLVNCAGISTTMPLKLMNSEKMDEFFQLLSAVRSLACEYAHRNIRFNCISPGAILTPINQDLPHMKNPDARAALEAKHLLGLGKTTDISNACIYLLSDASRWVTGQNLIVDGGYTAR